MQDAFFSPTYTTLYNSFLELLSNEKGPSDRIVPTEIASAILFCLHLMNLSKLLSYTPFTPPLTSNQNITTQTTIAKQSKSYQYFTYLLDII